MFPSPAESTFRDGAFWRTAAGLLFLSILAWGIYDRADSGKFDRFLWEFAALTFAVFCFALVWAMRRRITIHQEGICYVSLFRETDLTWDEITATWFHPQTVNMTSFGLLGVLIAMAASRESVTFPGLRITGPHTIRISARIRDAQEAIRLVLEKVDPRLRREAERLLASGAPAGFGSIRLLPQGVSWKERAPIPWNAIIKCRLEGDKLRIRAEGKWLDNIVVQSRKVPNLFVLMELIESRRPAPAATEAGAPLEGR